MPPQWSFIKPASLVLDGTLGRKLDIPEPTPRRLSFRSFKAQLRDNEELYIALTGGINSLPAANRTLVAWVGWTIVSDNTAFMEFYQRYLAGDYAEAAFYALTYAELDDPRIQP